jgi:hypothetical protein
MLSSPITRLTNAQRDNVLFGMPFDGEKYERVLRDVCLEEDLSDFPEGDQTQVRPPALHNIASKRRNADINWLGW